MPDDLKSLVRDTWADSRGEFRPCAFFDDRLDCIRVIARDCSVLEDRINERLTVLLDNYYPEPGRKQYVGFTVKGARHFCQEHGLDTATSIKMTELIDAILKSSPAVVVEWFVNIVARPVVEEGNIEQVEIPGDPQEQPA